MGAAMLLAAMLLAMGTAAAAFGRLDPCDSAAARASLACAAASCRRGAAGAARCAPAWCAPEPTAAMRGSAPRSVSRAVGAGPWRALGSASGVLAPGRARQGAIELATGRASFQGRARAGRGLPQVADGSQALALLAGVFAVLRYRASRARRSGVRAPNVARRVRSDIPKVKTAELAQKEQQRDTLSYSPRQESLLAELPGREWPDVLAHRKRQMDLVPPDNGAPKKKLSSRQAKFVRRVVQSYLRNKDVGRLIRFGMSEPPGDGRGFAAVALAQLGKFKEAAKLAAGPNGNSPCAYQTLRYVAHAMAKAGAVEAGWHLAQLQTRAQINMKLTTPGAWAFQTSLEVASLYLQATSEFQPTLLAAHGQQLAFRLEKLLDYRDDILACTPNRRYLMLTKPFNQLIRWLGRARLVPQALRACEIMNELGVPRDDMTIHFLSKGAVQQYQEVKRVARYSRAPPDLPGMRPEVVFVGRANAGKSAMINALLSCSHKPAAHVQRTRGLTRNITWYEMNRMKAGLPYFAMVDTPGLGFCGLSASVTRHWPELLYEYFSQRQALVHIFHLCDARNKKLLPADKKLIHLIATAQRRRVRYTIVITKIDVVKRRMAYSTAEAIREEMAPHVDVDIMFASARSLRGVDHLWAKIWQSVTETPRGQRHRDIGMNELRRLNEEGVPSEPDLAELLGVQRAPEKQPQQVDFDREEWVEDDRFASTAGEDDDDDIEPGEAEWDDIEPGEAEWDDEDDSDDENGDDWDDLGRSSGGLAGGAERPGGRALDGAGSWVPQASALDDGLIEADWDEEAEEEDEDQEFLDFERLWQDSASDAADGDADRPAGGADAGAAG